MLGQQAAGEQAHAGGLGSWQPVAVRRLAHQSSMHALTSRGPGTRLQIDPSDGPSIHASRTAFAPGKPAEAVEAATSPLPPLLLPHLLLPPPLLLLMAALLRGCTAA